MGTMEISRVQDLSAGEAAEPSAQAAERKGAQASLGLFLPVILLITGRGRETAEIIKNILIEQGNYRSI